MRDQNYIIMTAEVVFKKIKNSKEPFTHFILSPIDENGETGQLVHAYAFDKYDLEIGSIHRFYGELRGGFIKTEDEHYKPYTYMSIDTVLDNMALAGASGYIISSPDMIRKEKTMKLTSYSNPWIAHEEYKNTPRGRRIATKGK